MTDTGSLREPSPVEREILASLMSLPFPGRDELIAQMANISVRTIDADGSFEIVPTGGATSDVRFRVPVFAVAPDSDGGPISILLHVVNGRLKEVELYKDDGSTIRGSIQPSKREVSLSEDWDLP